MNAKMTVPAFAAAVLALAGCTGIETFDYASAPGPAVRFQESAGAAKSVAVLPFLDQRGAKYFDPAKREEAEDHPAGDHGSFWLGMFPLIPFGYVEKEEPENSEDFVTIGRWQFDLRNDLTAAAVSSLKSSNLFSSVTAARSAKETDADYLWRARVTNTRYSGVIITYGITYLLSPVLWVLGAPDGVSGNDFCVTYELIDRAGGQVLWTYNYRGHDYVTHWIYARMGKDVSLYPKLMKQSMSGALYNLNARLPSLKK